MAVKLLYRLEGDREPPTSVVTRRWGAGCNHQNIMMQEFEVEKWGMRREGVGGEVRLYCNNMRTALYF
jgi:hypothetical protein